MPHTPVAKLVGAGLALALIAHLWMFDAPTSHARDHTQAAVSVSTPLAPASISGCPTGMSACQTPMPIDALAALLLAALTGAVITRAVAAHDPDTGVDALAAPERDPPRPPVVPSSVVLLL